MTSLKTKLDGKSLTLQWDIAKNDIFDGFLSTAALTRYMLNTSWQLLDSILNDGVTSVTALIQISHEEPTPAGETITVEARVTEVVDNIIRIALKAVDETGVIAHGFNERHAVDRITLQKLANKRSEALKKIT